MSTTPNNQSEAAIRKGRPLCTGVLDYFPDALLAVAETSRIGNDQHNPGQPLHWAKEKSTDHADCIMRHLLDRGTLDTDGQRHSAKVAWRALALLQTEIDAERAAEAQTDVPEFRITVKLPVRDTNGDVFDIQDTALDLEIRSAAHGEMVARDLAHNAYLGRIVTFWARRAGILFPSQRFRVTAAREADEESFTIDFGKPGGDQNAFFKSLSLDEGRQQALKDRMNSDVFPPRGQAPLEDGELERYNAAAEGYGEGQH